MQGYEDLPGFPERKKTEVIESEGKREVVVMRRPSMRWLPEDETGRRMAIVHLHELGLATQEELSDVFQIHIKSIYKLY